VVETDSSGQKTPHDDTRAGEIEAAGYQVYYPDLGPDRYVYEIFQNSGCLMFGGDGTRVPLTWSEIDAFSKSLGAQLSAFERDALHKMSLAYFIGLRQGRDPLSVPPIPEDGDF